MQNNIFNSDFYQIIFNNASEAYAICFDNKFIECNDAVLKLFALSSKKDFIGKHPAHVSPEIQPDGSNSLQKSNELLTKSVTDGTLRFEWLHKRSTGEEFYADIVLTSLKLMDKIFIQVEIRDITERKEAELALYDSEKRFKTIFEKSADAYLLIENEVFIDCNAAAITLFGYEEKSEIIGKHPAELSPEFQMDGTSSIKKAEALFLKLTNTETIRFEWIHLKKNGDEFIADIVLTSFRIIKKIYFQVIIRDITEKKRIENELKENEERFRTIYENSADAYHFLYKNKFIDCNIKNLDLFGFENKEDFIGFHPAELSPEYQPNGKSSFDYANEMIQAAIDKGTIRFEWVHKRKDGKEFYADIVMTSFVFKHKVYVQTIIRDITAKKAIENSLKESEQRFRTIYENSADAYNFMYEGKFTDCNNANLSLFGFKNKEEFIGYHPADLSPEFQPDGERSYDLSNKMMLEALEKGTIRFEWLHKRTTGHEFYADIVLTSFKIENKNYLQTIIRDITVRKLAVSALKENEYKLRKIFEASPDAIIMADFKGEIIECNQRAVEMFGYSRKPELFECNVEDLIAPHEIEIARKKFINTIKEGFSGDVEIQMKRKDDTFFPSILSGALILDSKDKPQAVLGVIKDISEIRRLQKEIAISIDNERKRIGYNLHDDLGQTLTGILLHIGSLKQEYSDENNSHTKEIEYIEDLVKQAVKKTRILSRMLSPVDITKGGFCFAIEEMINEINSIYIISCGLQVKNKIKIEDNQIATHLYYIARESINNALKHSKADEINIVLDQNEKEFIMIISDNGQGPNKDKEMNGMGLGVMQYRCNLIGAHLELSQNEDKGFKVTVIKKL